MNYNEAIRFIDKSSIGALHYKDHIDVISKKQAYILAEMVCKSNVCNNCKYLDTDIGKSFDSCTKLDINIGHHKVLGFSCSEHSENKRS